MAGKRGLNILVVVQAIARQTLGAAAPGSPVGVFQARLLSLAKAHTLLTQANREEAPLDDVVRDAMSSYPAEQVLVEGPPVDLNSRAVVALSLILHELGTNAAKYGALASDHGSLRISWCYTDEVKKHLQLTWSETAHQSVVAPTTKGFGSRLIEGLVSSELHGTVEATYRPTGLLCELRFPADNGSE